MYYNENKLAFESCSRYLLRVITTGVAHEYIDNVRYYARKFYMKRMTGVSSGDVYESICSYKSTYVYNIMCSLYLLFDVFSKSKNKCTYTMKEQKTESYISCNLTDLFKMATIGWH